MNIENKLKKKNLKCSGCTACFAICPKDAITMQSDLEGFKYPVVEKNKCIYCGLCSKVCPLDNAQSNFEEDKISFACSAKDENFIKQSSSGGGFAILANMYIKEQAVIYGAAFDDNWNVCHIRVDKKDELKRLYTSKYVQSDMGNTFRNVKLDLDNGKKVLFVGTPCQVAGLKSYLQKDYLNLLAVDFICHGVPSPLVWQRYIEELEQNLNSKITEISFRNKKDGWENYCFMLKTADGNVSYEKVDNNIYMQGFLKDLYLRPSCYDCKFKTLSRLSDISLADFWGIENILPEMKNDKGVSLCWANSEKGNKILAKILKQMIYKEVSLQDAVKYNPSAIKSVHIHKNRDKFFKCVDRTDDIINSIERYYDKRYFQKRFFNKIKKSLIIKYFRNSNADKNN